jgi:hypothetical protein
VRVVPVGITTGAGAGAGEAEFDPELAGLEFEVEPALSGELLDVPEVPDELPEWLQPPKIKSRPAIRQRLTIGFSILPPFPLQVRSKSLFIDERYFSGLSDSLKSGWADHVRIRYSTLRG